jgi:hypothetical protein
MGGAALENPSVSLRSSSRSSERGLKNNNPKNFSAMSLFQA